MQEDKETRRQEEMEALEDLDVDAPGFDDAQENIAQYSSNS